MLAFRIVIVDEKSDTTTVVVTTLERTPEEGDTIALPHNLRVVVRSVVTDEHGRLGVVNAVPASRAG
jgi:hypothetical protein